MKTNSMMTGQPIRRSAPCAVMLAAVLTGACGGEPPLASEDQAVSVVTEAFGTSSCASVEADTYMVHPLTGLDEARSVTSPTTYDTCGKGYVVDVIHNEYGLGLPDFNWHKEVTVTWAGPIPRTQAGCEDLEGSAILYDYDPSGTPDWINGQRKSVTGRWVRADVFHVCSLPSMTFTAYRAEQTRVAATMRYMSGSNPTHAVKIKVRTTFVGDFF